MSGRGRGRKIRNYAEYKRPIIEPFREAEAVKRFQDRLASKTNASTEDAFSSSSSTAASLSSPGRVNSAAQNNPSHSSHHDSGVVRRNDARMATLSRTSSGASVTPPSSATPTSSEPTTPTETLHFQFPFIDRHEDDVAEGYNAIAAEKITTNLRPDVGDLDSATPSAPVNWSSVEATAETRPERPVDAATEISLIIEEPSVAFRDPKPFPTIPSFAGFEEIRSFSGIPPIFCAEENRNQLYEGYDCEVDDGEGEHRQDEAPEEEASIMDSCEQITKGIRLARIAEERRNEKAALLEAERKRKAVERAKKFAELARQNSE